MTIIRIKAAAQEVDVKQQEVILRDSLAVYGRALRSEEMTTAELASTSMGTHMTSLFPVGPPTRGRRSIC